MAFRQVLICVFGDSMTLCGLPRLGDVVRSYHCTRSNWSGATSMHGIVQWYLMNTTYWIPLSGLFLPLLRFTIFWRWRKHADTALSVCTHSLFLRAREPVCAISLGTRDLALRLANKHTTSLPEDSDTEYSILTWIFQRNFLCECYLSW